MTPQRLFEDNEEYRGMVEDTFSWNSKEADPFTLKLGYCEANALLISDADLGLSPDETQAIATLRGDLRIIYRAMVDKQNVLSN